MIEMGRYYSIALRNEPAKSCNFFYYVKNGLRVHLADDWSCFLVAQPGCNTRMWYTVIRDLLVQDGAVVGQPDFISCTLLYSMPNKHGVPAVIIALPGGITAILITA